MEVLYTMSQSLKFFSASFILLVFLLQPCAGEDNYNESLESTPKLKVRGYGFWGNRELKRNIGLLATEEPDEYYEAAFIEDGAFMITSRLKQDGYLNPLIKLHLKLKDGTKRSFSWEDSTEIFLPRPIEAVEVVYEINPGTLYYYQDLSFTGLTLITDREARRYFIPEGFLLQLKRTRRFTSERLNESLFNLRSTLAEYGYQRARAMVTKIQQDDETGAVKVEITVEEGKMHVIRDVTKEVYYDGETEPAEIDEIELNEPFTTRRVQDKSLELRNRFLRKGYPETRVDTTTEVVGEYPEKIEKDLFLKVHTGEKKYAGEIKFEGLEKTSEPFLRRKVEVSAGEELDTLALEDARHRLARLGIFERVELEYKEVDPETLDPVFRVVEGKEIEAGLLLGYGSYEMFRGGVEIERYNIFGRAHRSRMLAVQSLKSSSIDYRYTIPDLLERDIDAFSTLSALRRREIDYLRKEYGGTVGFQKYLKQIESDISIRYGYQMLESGRFEAAEADGIERAQVGSVSVDLRRDHRNNPILPEEGHKLMATVETASEYFPGEANYKKLELAASSHHGIRRGGNVHLGFSHGLVHTYGSVQNNLPFNKRFFQGGENSVRGYQSGEASPRNIDGKLVGAETYTLLNLEYEQMIIPSWSVALFSDSIAIARRMGNYPSDEELYSVGAGIRYRTFMGPIRAEYGHNLNPRDDDPSGTFHFSIGFPF